MATDNTDPQNAKPVGGRRPHENPSKQAGQATKGLGNEQGQRTAQQQGAKGTLDQGGSPMGRGQDLAGGPATQERHRESGHALRQGTPETEEAED